MRSIAILGGGVWGKAFGNAIAANNSICFWDRDISIAETVNGAFHQNLPDAIATAELIIIAVSSNGFADILKQLTAHYSQAAVPMPPVMWLTKGFVEQSRLLSESAAVHLPPNACFGAISGPTFAQEINRHLPAALALAVNQPQELPALQKLLHRKNLRFYPSQDLIGVCIGGALKNVIAIAAGISDGLNLGENARAAIITRGLAEMAAFNHQLGGQAATMQGVAGVGDLLLTCTSDLSRNRQFGIAIGCAQKPSTATAEGVTASAGAHFRATQIALDMPICNAVYQVLHENMPPLEAVESLLSRPPPKI